MFKHTIFVYFVISFTDSVLCGHDKNNFTASEAIPRELVKNQFKNVHLNHENIPIITNTSLQDLEDVEKLEIKSSKVTKIEKGAFDNLRLTLKRLSLKHNSIEEIKNDVFNHLRLQDLDLSDNNIKSIEKDAFDDMWALETIRLSNNKIEVFDNDWFKDVKSLQHLHLENNLIKFLPARILGGGKMYFVDVFLSYNRIEKIDVKAFAISQSNHLFFDRLYLDHNEISRIEDQTFDIRGKINDLRLDHNQIKCLSVNMENVRKFNVSFNPWDRECLSRFQGRTRGGNLSTTTHDSIDYEYQD